MPFRTLILVLAIFVSEVNSQTFHWTRTNGPNEGNVNDFFSATNGKLYAASWGGVFESSDNGENWKYIGLGNKIVTAIAYFNGYLFAGTSINYNISEGDNGLFISTNNGLSWQLSSLGICGVSDIYVSNSGKIFVTYLTDSFYDGYCSYSTDNGISWININQLTGFRCSEFSPGPGNSIYISAGFASMVYSTDDGNSWITNGNTSYGIYSIDASINGNIFGGSTEMLYRSTNNGINWDSVNYMNIYRVTEVKSFNNGFTFVGTSYDGVWRSSDFGDNWIGFWYPDSSNRFVSCLEKNNNDVWSSFFYGTSYRTTNNGNDWEEKSIGLSSSTIYEIFKTSNGNILTGTTAGIHLSTDGGINWERVSVDYKTVRTFTETSNGEILAFGNRIYKSTNQGHSWQLIFNNHPNTIYASIKGSNNILFYTADNGIFKSADNGLTWQLSLYQQNSFFFDISSNTNGDVFVNSNSKIYRTTNNGLNWVNIYTSPDELNVIAVSPSSNIYVSKQRSILKSTDNGNTFIDLNIDIDVNFNHFLFLDNDRFVVATEKNGVYYFDGASSYPINIGLDIKYVWSLAANAEGKVLAGTVKSGIYITNGPIGVDPISSEIPSQFSLYQNYPNPFNPSTKIKFQIPLSRGVAEGQGVFTKLLVYDVMGREVAVLVNQQLRSGTFEVDWDATTFPSGVYFYKINIGTYSETKRMVLLK